MINKPIDAVTKPDIDQLVADSVTERRSLEFKRSLPGSSDDEKREFLADVSSFANSIGGDILYGMEADDGVPTGAKGLVGVNEDAERLRIESMIRDGLKPRLQGAQLRFIPGFPDGPLMLLRVPRSSAGPHMVVFKNHSKFFARASAGKWQMDVDELRIAFTIGADLSERMRAWKRNRVAVVAADQGPASVVSGARLIVHIMPVSAFRAVEDLGVAKIAANRLKFLPIHYRGVDHRFNIDGFLSVAPTIDERSGIHAYVQVYRDGRIEAVQGDIAVPAGNALGIASLWFEEKLISWCRTTIAGLVAMDVEPPLVISASIVGARGAFLFVGNSSLSMTDVRPIDRDLVELPEVTIDDLSTPIDVTLKPLFDGLWNACGLAHSWHYDASGRWKRK